MEGGADQTKEDLFDNVTCLIAFVGTLDRESSA